MRSNVREIGLSLFHESNVSNSPVLFSSYNLRDSHSDGFVRMRPRKALLSMFECRFQKPSMAKASREHKHTLLTIR
jgi:hypothetical protein